VGNAVERNRVKRRLRALLRQRLPDLDGGSLLVVRAQQGANDLTSSELGAQLDEALRRVRRRAMRGVS